MKTPKMHEVEGEASVDEGPSSGALTVGSRPEIGDGKRGRLAR